VLAGAGAWKLGRYRSWELTLMGVEFCIWLWRMYRFKQKQDRLQAKLSAQELSGIPQKSNANGDAQLAR